MTSNPLIGTWRLISWETRSVDGQKISYPLGKDTVGYIMYNEDGYMFVAIIRPNRVRFAAGDLLGGSIEEKVQAAGPMCPIAVGMNFGEAQSSSRGSQLIS
jgi:Lipocalin-like domain